MRIFLSYRRADTLHQTGGLYRALCLRYGRGNVFMDTSFIQPGDDFGEKIAEFLATCDHVLVMIGAGWLEASDDNGRRLDDPEDMVRVEVDRALASRARVIPVLVDGAGMPEDTDLPENIRPLARLNAARLRPDPDFEIDVERIVAAMGGEPRSRRWMLWALGLLSVPAAAVLLPGNLLFDGYVQAPPSTPPAPRPPNRVPVSPPRPAASDVAEIASLGRAREAEAIAVDTDNAVLTLGVTGGIYRHDIERGTGTFTAVAEAEGTSVDRVASIPGGGLLLRSGSGLVRLMNARRTLPLERDRPEVRYRDFAVAHDAGVAAVIDMENGVRTVDLRARSARLHLGGMGWTQGVTWFQRIAVSPSGLQIAVGVSDGTVYLFEREADAGPRRIEGAQGDGIADLVFSPDGRYLAAGYRDGTLHVHDTRTGRRLPLAGPEIDRLAALAFSPDSRRLAYGGYSLSREGVAGVVALDGDSVIAHTGGGPVRALAYGRGGRALYAAGDRPALRIMDIPTAD